MQSVLQALEGLAGHMMGHDPDADARAAWQDVHAMIGLTGEDQDKRIDALEDLKADWKPLRQRLEALEAALGADPKVDGGLAAQVQVNREHIERLEGRAHGLDSALHVAESRIGGLEDDLHDTNEAQDEAAIRTGILGAQATVQKARIDALESSVAGLAFQLGGLYATLGPIMRAVDAMAGAIGTAAAVEQCVGVATSPHAIAWGAVRAGAFEASQEIANQWNSTDAPEPTA